MCSLRLVVFFSNIKKLKVLKIITVLMFLGFITLFSQFRNEEVFVVFYRVLRYFSHLTHSRWGWRHSANLFYLNLLPCLSFDEMLVLGVSALDRKIRHCTVYFCGVCVLENKDFVLEIYLKNLCKTWLVIICLVDFLEWNCWYRSWGRWRGWKREKRSRTSKRRGRT